jgi:hypothetical protein
LTTLIRTHHDPRVIEYVERWLTTYPLGNRYWLGLWNALMGFTNRSSRTRRLGLKKLKESTVKPFFSYSWSLVWTSLWRVNSDRPELIGLAELATQASQGQSRPFVDYVLFPLVMSESATPSVIDSARKWLAERPQSTIIWASMYLKVLPHQSSEEFFHLGRIWLRHYGGNMNRWHDIWQAMGKVTSVPEWFDLGSRWLRRARWDLGSWPVVFTELAAMRLTDGQIQELQTIGKRWSEWWGPALHKSRKIRQAMSYLETRRKGRLEDA